MPVGIIGYMATNALAMGVVINAIFGVGIGWGIWLGMGVTLAYSVAGGILAGIYNDVFQGTLMAAASVLVFLFVLKVGGGLGDISNTILGADPKFLSPWGKMTPLAALSFFFVFGMGSLGQPQGVHKYYMLRDPLQLKWYPLLKTLGSIRGRGARLQSQRIRAQRSAFHVQFARRTSTLLRLLHRREQD